MVQTFMLGNDEYTVQEMKHSPHFTSFSVVKNSEQWTYVNIGVLESVLSIWRHSGSPAKATDFLREVAGYVIKLGIQNNEIKADLKQLLEGKPILRYVFLPLDKPATVTRERTNYHDAETTCELTVRRIKWLAEVNSYRLAHQPTLSL